MLDGQGCKSDAGGYVTWSLDQLGMICGCCAYFGWQGTKQGDNMHALGRRTSVNWKCNS